MTLNEYQERAMTTRMESCDNFGYMFLNLAGELGEFASKIAKSIRRNEVIINGNRLFVKFSIEGDKSLRLEAGDILWQLAGLCATMGWELDEVAQDNLDKLAARKTAGTIDGNGDGISGAERN